ncbi:YcxB family protein [Sphingomonas sp. H39-1-10]|uniref:YcxB family protein n=1 Tax=Sphingomonas pollutisoli TaxID=3030829 RepID=UPI0023BA2CE9|nr:YcxB family protein [Sphingomonas pollutisoli]MDF0488134.1 YcxB family protein [Sphingomonas pollutisoli]
MTRSVTFTPSEADYVAAMRANFVRAIRRRRVIFRVTIAALVFAAIGAAIGLADGGILWAVPYALGGLTYGAILFAIIYVSSYLLLPRRAARLFRQQRSIHQSFDYRWSEDGLEWSSPQGSGRFPWTDLHGWRETKPAVLIYMNDTLFQFLPQRAFTPEAVADLRATLERSGLPIY